MSDKDLKIALERLRVENERLKQACAPTTKEHAEALTRTVLRRRADDIISGRATKPVSPGWAMGHFYENSSVAHTDCFEIKVWGGPPKGRDARKPRHKQPGSFNRHWLAHDGGGPEYIQVFEGTLTVHFGFRDAADGKVRELKRPFSPVRVTAGETIILPEGLLRKFSGRDAVRALTVRARPACAEHLPAGG
jgi:hypothetical protein